MQLLLLAPLRSPVRDGLLRGLVARVCAGRQDTVQPCLLVLVAGSCEGGAGELLGVETVWWLLGGVLADGEGALDGFGSGIFCQT